MNYKKASPWGIVGCLSLTLFFAAQISHSVGTGTLEPSLKSRPGEILIKLKNAESANAYNGILGSVSATHVRTLRSSSQHRLIKTTGDVDKVVGKLRQNLDIEYADPNYIYRATKVKDFAFKQQWSFHNEGQKFEKVGRGTPGADIDIVRLWDEDPSFMDAAADVIVAVIDTGIQTNHGELKKNIWNNPGERGPWKASTPEEKENALPFCKDKKCNGIDDDGNGYVDDYKGWDWFNDTENSDDDNAHGTHCAGVIGAAHNNWGTVGINNKVKLMSLKFLSKKGEGTLDGAVDAIAYARDKGAKVINASWGSSQSAENLKAIINEVTEDGVLFVAAAGNSAEDNDIAGSFPANYNFPGVISVVATDFHDKKAWFSSYGRHNTHLSAPGVNIFSTVTGWAYKMMSGTSMAAPHVAGVAAMLAGLEPSLTPVQLKERMMNSSEVTAELLGKTLSGGRLDAYAAVKGIIAPGHRKPDRSNWSHTFSASFETPHPYVNGETYRFAIEHPGASWIRVNLGRFSVESGNDYVKFYDSEGNLYDAITGMGFSATSRPIPGSRIYVELDADAYVRAWGFTVTGYEILN